jgi:hypothetical protein
MGMPPNFMGMPPSVNGAPHPQYMQMGRGIPHPSMMDQHQQQSRPGLEKWFGQSIYNNTGYNNNAYQAGPLPPNARMMSLEELERVQPTNVSQSSK